MSKQAHGGKQEVVDPQGMEDFGALGTRQQLPQAPWSRTGVTTPLSRQSKAAGAAPALCEGQRGASSQHLFQEESENRGR